MGISWKEFYYKTPRRKIYQLLEGRKAKSEGESRKGIRDANFAKLNKMTKGK